MFPARDGPGGQLARTMAGCDVGACWPPPGQGGSRARAAPAASVCGCTCKAMRMRDLRLRDGTRWIGGPIVRQPVLPKYCWLATCA